MKCITIIIALLVAAIFIGETKMVTCYEVGPYEVKDLQLLPCEDQGTNELNISVEMFRTNNRTHRVFAHRGAITFPPNAEHFRVSMEVYRKGSDWILVFTHEDELCKFLESMPTLFTLVAEAFEANRTCPFPAGRYAFDEYIVGFPSNKTTIPTFPYGLYKGKVNIFNAKKEVNGCVYLLGTVVKKYPKITLG